MTIDRIRAEEELRAIRSLIERASVYRAVSVRAALCAASLAIGAAIFIHRSELRPREFAIVWLFVLIAVLIANTLFLWREAKRDGRPLISPSMKLALRAVTPCLIVPAAVTGWYLTTGYLGAQELLLVSVWIAFYALALLCTTLFAPRSVTTLGWCFLLSALAIPVVTNFASDEIALRLPNLLMAITFGGYHLVYALFAWRRDTSAYPSPND